MSGEESTFENGEGDTAPRVQGNVYCILKMMIKMAVRGA